MRGVASLVAGGPSEAVEPATRAKGVRLGAKILFASLVSFPLTLALAIAVDGPVPLLFSVLVFLVGFFRVLYAALFEEGPWRRSLLAPAAAAPPALPAYQTPVSFAPPARTTGELAAPPSVTEHTTRHLER